MGEEEVLGQKPHSQDTRGCKALIASAYRLPGDWLGGMPSPRIASWHPAEGHIACVGINMAIKWGIVRVGGPCNSEVE